MHSTNVFQHQLCAFAKTLRCLAYLSEPSAAAPAWVSGVRPMMTWDKDDAQILQALQVTVKTIFDSFLLQDHSDCYV